MFADIYYELFVLLYIMFLNHFFQSGMITTFIYFVTVLKLQQIEQY